MSGRLAETLDAADLAELPLRRNRDFQLLWSGSAFALLGKEITDLVYPLVVLAVTGSPAWAGAFGGVQLFVSLLVGLPAGALAGAPWMIVGDSGLLSGRRFVA